MAEPKITPLVKLNLSGWSLIPAIHLGAGFVLGRREVMTWGVGGTWRTNLLLKIHVMNPCFMGPLKHLGVGWHFKVCLWIAQSFTPLHTKSFLGFFACRKKVTLLFFGSRAICLNFHTAHQPILMAVQNRYQTIADKLSICVSQHQALFVKQDANDINNNLEDNIRKVLPISGAC